MSINPMKKNLQQKPFNQIVNVPLGKTKSVIETNESIMAKKTVQPFSASSTLKEVVNVNTFKTEASLMPKTLQSSTASKAANNFTSSFKKTKSSVLPKITKKTLFPSASRTSKTAGTYYSEDALNDMIVDLIRDEQEANEVYEENFCEMLKDEIEIQAELEQAATEEMFEYLRDQDDVDVDIDYFDYDY